MSSDDLCSLVGEVLWVTTKSSAPLRRFIDLDNFDDWGGFLGKWNMIDSELQKTLRDIGFEPNISIDESIARELVKNFSTGITTELFITIAEQSTSNTSATSMVIQPPCIPYPEPNPAKNTSNIWAA